MKTTRYTVIMVVEVETPDDGPTLDEDEVKEYVDYSELIVDSIVDDDSRTLDAMVYVKSVIKEEIL